MGGVRRRSFLAKLELREEMDGQVLEPARNLRTCSGVREHAGTYIIEDSLGSVVAYGHESVSDSFPTHSHIVGLVSY